MKGMARTQTGHPKHQSLMDRFRQANGKIIHVQSVRAKDHPEFTFFGKEYSLIEDSPAVEFVEELKPDC